MNPPVNRDITIYQYATWNDTITWKAGDPPEPVNLTGYAARMQIRATPQSGVIVELSNANDRITFDALEGQIFLVLSHEVTGDMPVGSGVYDLVMTRPDETKIRLSSGKVNVIGGVTRP